MEARESTATRPDQAFDEGDFVIDKAPPRPVGQEFIPRLPVATNKDIRNLMTIFTGHGPRLVHEPWSPKRLDLSRSDIPATVALDPNGPHCLRRYFGLLSRSNKDPEYGSSYVVQTVFRQLELILLTSPIDIRTFDSIYSAVEQRWRQGDLRLTTESMVYPQEYIDWVKAGCPPTVRSLPRDELIDTGSTFESGQANSAKRKASTTQLKGTTSSKKSKTGGSVKRPSTSEEDEEKDEDKVEDRSM